MDRRADFLFDLNAILRAASESESEAIVAQNYQWLRSEAVSQTDGYRIWSRLAFLERCEGKTPDANVNSGICV
jgi:hypothetical protein